MSSMARKRRGQAQARRTAQCKALAAGLIVLSLTHNSSYLHNQLSHEDHSLQCGGVAEQLLAEEPTLDEQQYNGKGRLSGASASLPASWRAAERLLDEVRELGRRDFYRRVARSARNSPAVVAHLQEYWRDTDNVAFAFYTSAEGKPQMDQAGGTFLPPLSPLQTQPLTDDDMTASCWKGLLDGPSTQDKPLSSSARSTTSSTSSGGGGASPSWSAAGSISPLPMDLLNVTDGGLFEQHVSEGILEFEDPIAAETRLRDEPSTEAFPLRWMEDTDVITPVMQNIFNLSADGMSEGGDALLNLANLHREGSLMSLDGDSLSQPSASVAAEPLEVEPDFLDAINNVNVSSDNAFLNMLNNDPIDNIEEVKQEKNDAVVQEPFVYDTYVKPAPSGLQTNETFYDNSSHRLDEEAPWVAEEVIYHNQSESPPYLVEASDSEEDAEDAEDVEMMEMEMEMGRRFSGRRRGGVSWEDEQELARRRTEREIQRLRQAGLNRIHPEQLARCPQEDFNNMLAQRGLTSSQAELLRDVRRRGRNKLAASKCRQRKAYRLAGAEAQLERARDRGDSLRAAIEARTLQLRGLKQEYQHLYKMAFRRMQWADGSSVDPRLYRLQLLPDGRVLVVRRDRPS